MMRSGEHHDDTGTSRWWVVTDDDAPSRIYFTPIKGTPCMPTKSILASKTFWSNVLGGIAAGSGLATGVIPPKYAPAVVATGAIANILLRLVTKQPIA